MKQIESVVLLGAGNVATHLGKAFFAAGICVEQVFSRRLNNAVELAGHLGCKATDSLADLHQGADLYVIAISDDAIAQIAGEFPFSDALLVHTSGSVDMNVLSSGSNNYGVFYPLQTFSRNIPVDFRKVPLCLECADKKAMYLLNGLADRLSGTVAWVSSEKRRTLHLAAVFACNFVNHMYATAGEILKDGEMPFDLLRPLIAETAKKVMLTDPYNAQTGPARRKNKKVMAKHTQMLGHKPEIQQLYRKISESIVKMYRNNGSSAKD